jgi:predicted outer membrane repeat protein
MNKLNHTLAFVLLIGLHAPQLRAHAAPAQATSATRSYPGVAPCNTTLQACISASVDSDIILIASGTYITDSLVITRAISVAGIGSVTLRPTSGRMIQYSAVPPDKPFSLEQLTLEDGNTGANSGGVIRVATGSAAPVFRKLIIQNVASGGGALRILPAIPITLTNVTFISNTSSSDGGAILSNGPVTLGAARFERNSAAGSGGAISAPSVTISGSVFIDNSALVQGGAISTTYALIERSVFERNTARSDGAAIVTLQNAEIRHSRFVSNTGDIALIPAVTLGGIGNVSDSAFELNSGALKSVAATGVFDTAFPSLIVASSWFTRNSANRGSAINCPFNCAISTSQFVENNTDKAPAFAANQFGLGGAVLGSAFTSIDRSEFVRNRSTVAGGAVYIDGSTAVFGTQAMSVTNSLFAANTAPRGNAIAVEAGLALSLTLAHNTIVSGSLTPGSAVLISGTTRLLNNIVTNHASAIERVGGTVFEDFNLLHANTRALSGTVASGGTQRSADPLFINPAQDDFHLRPDSPAINAGTNAGVTMDIDGQLRPQQGAFDIGFDEALGVPKRGVFLPLALR